MLLVEVVEGGRRGIDFGGEGTYANSFCTKARNRYEGGGRGS